MNLDKEIKKSTVINYGAKFINIAISLYIVRLTLSYLGDGRYGAWATILSIITMLTVADMGIGNGLKNKITETLARGRKEAIKEYISTAFYLILTIAAIIMVTSILFINLFVHKGYGYSDFKLALILAMLGVAFNFVFGLVNSMLYAYQKSAMVTVGQVINALFLLTGVLTLKYAANPNLILMAAVYDGALLFSNGILWIIFLRGNREAVPKLKYFKKSRIPAFLGISIKFFLLQLCGLVLFYTDNIIISKTIGLKEVTQYDILNKVFNNLALLYSILLIPIWSAITYALVKKDHPWIKKTIKRLQLLLIPFILGIILVAVFLNTIVYYWLGKSMPFSREIILLFSMYTIMGAWSSIYCSVVNGMGKIDLQLYLAAAGALINIPLSIYFAVNLSMGIYGVKLATLICQVPTAILLPLQVRAELKRRREAA